MAVLFYAMTMFNLQNTLMHLERLLTKKKAMHCAALCLTKGLNMDKSEMLYGIVCVIVFAFIGVLLAWRG
jgi:NhaP-type Na+/H+ or K+/H+ antiporter